MSRIVELKEMSLYDAKKIVAEYKKNPTREVAESHNFLRAVRIVAKFEGNVGNAIAPQRKHIGEVIAAIRQIPDHEDMTATELFHALGGQEGTGLRKDNFWSVLDRYEIPFRRVRQTIHYR